MRKKILVIGGGASGMVAAIMAARQGADVTIIEQQSELGKKILATGNGRCNFTNLSIDVDDYYCEETEMLSGILETYTPDVIIDFFESIGVLARERNGYIYPTTDQASNIRDALVAELELLQVKIYLEMPVSKIICATNKNPLFQVDVETQIKKFSGEGLILATGGKSGLHKSIEYHGFSLIQDTKHTLTILSPALVALIGKGKFYKKLAGIRTDVCVTALVNQQPIRSEIGEIQLTDYGISGIPVFQISRILTQELSKQAQGKEHNFSVEIDFMPDYSMQELMEYFLYRKDQFMERRMKQFLLGVLKDKLASFLLYTARIDENAFIKNISTLELEKLCRICKTFSVQIEGMKEFSQSQVTAGGVPMSEVTEYLESDFHKGLYFTGEILDVDGICGGYNLHFAWASAMLVGTQIVK
ncbi:MAG: aminoacetone oxidase family FAD-binding enzyme [Eubacteriales bacterium]